MKFREFLQNINRVPRNSGALGEIAREAREKKSFFSGFTGGNRSKTVQKRFGNIIIHINRVLRTWGAPKNPTINRVQRIPD